MGMSRGREGRSVPTPAAPTGAQSGAEADDRICLWAQRLAIRFTRATDLPPRLTKVLRTAQTREPTSDSEAERRLVANAQAWEVVIRTMVNKIADPTVWRLVTLMPEVGRDVHSVSECQDFTDLVDYLVLRRDKEACDDDELGLLATLLTALQRETEAGLASRDAK